MAGVGEDTPTSATEMVATGRRHLAVRDFNAATETLAKACEMMAQEHGESADQCAEPYLWYGKSLLGLSREESGVLGDGVTGTGNKADDDEENGEGNEEPEKMENGEEGEKDEDGEKDEGEDKDEEEDEKEQDTEMESTTKGDEPTTSSDNKDKDPEQPGTSNGEEADESAAELPEEDDVDNLQLAWEMLDLSRSILKRRLEGGGGEATQALLAEVHLALGEVALESETYDKAVVDMQSCLEIQKQLYQSDDRRIAETHYQIGLANSLASNFEDSITHFKNAANILETRIKILEDPASATEDATVKKFSNDPFYSIESEIKELKGLLPEIQEKIQDMMDYKAETIRRVREQLCPSNGQGSSSNGASSSSEPKKVSDISHLVKRKRKSSENGDASAPKRSNT